MQYRCEACGLLQVRGFFPAEVFHIRYAIFHGFTMGVSSVAVKVAFATLGYEPSGWSGAVLSFGTGVATLLIIYGLAVIIEQLIVVGRGCVQCRSPRVFVAL